MIWLTEIDYWVPAGVVKAEENQPAEEDQWSYIVVGIPHHWRRVLMAKKSKANGHHLYKYCARANGCMWLGEWCWQVEAERDGNSMYRFHQPICEPFTGAQYKRLFNAHETKKPGENNSPFLAWQISLLDQSWIEGKPTSYTLSDFSPKVSWYHQVKYYYLETSTTLILLRHIYMPGCPKMQLDKIDLSSYSLRGAIG